MQFRKTLLIPVTALLIFAIISCSEDSPTRSETDLWNDVNNLVSNKMNPGGSGYGILVVKNGAIAFAKGWGMANIQNSIPFTADTPINIASITKQFTATAILILYERGLLDLQEKIIGYFPEFPASWSSITVHHLLTHQSGIPNYSDLLNGWEEYEGLTNEQALDLAVQQNDLDFQPGQGYSYSNTGYIVLAILIEKITNMSYPEFMKQNILTPLQMSFTFVQSASTIYPATTAISYNEYNQPYNYNIYTYGDGGIYSTLNDMFKWDLALFGNQIVSQATLQLAFTGYTGGNDNYGYGWMISSYNGYPSQRHGGYTMGNLNYIYRVPGKNFTYLMLSNGGVFANNGFETWTTEVQDMIFYYYF